MKNLSHKLLITSGLVIVIPLGIGALGYFLGNILCDLKTFETYNCVLPISPIINLMIGFFGFTVVGIGIALPLFIIGAVLGLFGAKVASKENETVLQPKHSRNMWIVIFIIGLFSAMFILNAVNSAANKSNLPWTKSADLTGPFTQSGEQIPPSVGTDAAIKQTQTSSEPDVSAQNVTVQNENCDQATLYGYPYYEAANKEIICYKTAQLKTGDSTSFVPLENISAAIIKKIVPGNISNTIYDVALDKNYFYINGAIRYSVQDKTYEYLNAPGYGKFGLIAINGEEYQVVMTGTVGATLKEI